MSRGIKCWHKPILINKINIMTHETLSVSRFSNLSERYISIASPRTVKDIKQWFLPLDLVSIWATTSFKDTRRHKKMRKVGSPNWCSQKLFVAMSVEIVRKIKERERDGKRWMMVTSFGFDDEQQWQEREEREEQRSGGKRKGNSLYLTLSNGEDNDNGHSDCMRDRERKRDGSQGMKNGRERGDEKGGQREKPMLCHIGGETTKGGGYSAGVVAGITSERRRGKEVSDEGEEKMAFEWEHVERNAWVGERILISNSSKNSLTCLNLLGNPYLKI